MPKAAGKTPKQSGKARKKRRRKQAKRYVLHYFLLVAFCTAVAAMMCYSVFFKVERIKVVGNTVYSEQQIIDLTGVELQENLFQINVSSIAKKMKAKLYYIQSVKVKRRLPTTLLVEIVEEEPMGAIYTPQGYSIVSVNGKVLETKVLSPPESIPCVLGMEYGGWEQGDYIKAKTDNPREAGLDPRILLLQSFQKVMKSYEMTDFDYVDLSDIYNIQAMYDGKILVSFGGEHKLDQKMLMFKNALSKQLPGMPKEAGVVDVSDATSLRSREIELSKIKDPKAYTEFGTGEDTSQIGQAQNETPELPENPAATGPEESADQNPIDPEQTEEVAPQSQIPVQPAESPAEEPGQVINGQPSAAAPVTNQSTQEITQQPNDSTKDESKDKSIEKSTDPPEDEQRSDGSLNTPSRPPIVNKG